jgi:ubiquinone/menaquinone biosynthesis C-methylase UbiE
MAAIHKRPHAKTFLWQNSMTEGSKKYPGKSRTECPVCYTPSKYAMIESSNYYFCNYCHVIYRRIVPQSSAGEIWDEDYYSKERVVSYYLKRYSGFRKMVKMAGQLVGKPGKWLDIGCGVGTLLEAAHERGWEVYGIDKSGICVEIANKRIKGCQIVHGDILEKLQDFSGINVVSFTDTLRHLEYPGMILSDLHKVLIKGGWVFIREVKANSRRGSRLRENRDVNVTSYLQEWVPQSLENTLLLAGFRNVYSMPSPAFTECTHYENCGTASLRDITTSIFKPLSWPTSRLIYRVTYGRIILGPNFITMGQK